MIYFCFKFEFFKVVNFFYFENIIYGILKFRKIIEFIVME